MARTVAAWAVVSALLLPAVVAAGVREQAGMALAVRGGGPGAADLLGWDPASGSRAERYARALALDRAGFRATALGVWTELATTQGAFAGPALEEVVAREFARGRYDRVAGLGAAARSGRFADPDALWYRVGQSLWMVGRKAEAAEALAKVGAGPFVPFALHTLAQIRFEQNRHAEALDLLARAVESAPQPLADRLRLTRGRILYQVAAGLSGLDDEARKRGLEVAREQFGRIGPESPWYGRALEGVGWCDLEAGATAEALAAFTLAAELDPDRAPVLLWAQGRAYEAAGVPAEAARWYGEARRAALDRAEALEERAADPEPDPVWAGEARRARAVGARIERIEGRLAAAAAGIAVREAFLSARGARVDGAEERLGALSDELERMEAGIEGHLDRVGVEGLVPAAARPRIAGLTVRHRALAREIDRLYAWARALDRRDPGAARGLRDRLAAAAAGLAEARAGFLNGLRDRVARRQRELASRIRELRARVSAAAPGVDRARGAVETELDRAARARERLRGLEDRLGAAGRALEALRREALERGRAAAADRLRAEAAGWRRRADLYALDETQALHLLRERGRR